MKPADLFGAPFVCIPLIIGSSSAAPLDETPNAFASNELRPEIKRLARSILVEGLQATGFWQRMHAAEFLIELGDSATVEPIFDGQFQAFESSSPERIGVWRLGYRLANSGLDQKLFANKIRSVALQEDAPDRLHAVETLAKLSLQLPPDEVVAIVTRTRVSGDHEAAFGLWVAVNQRWRLNVEADQRALVSLLLSEDQLGRLRSGVALWSVMKNSPYLREAVIDAGVQATRVQVEGSIAQLAGAQVVATAWAVARWCGANKEIEKLGDTCEEELSAVLKAAAAEDSQVSRVLADALAELGSPADGERLLGYLDEESIDLRISAANALLKIELRCSRDQGSRSERRAD